MVLPGSTYPLTFDILAQCQKKHDIWKASRFSNKSNKWVQIGTEGIIHVNEWLLMLAGVLGAATRAKRIGEFERKSGKVGKF